MQNYTKRFGVPVKSAIKWVQHHERQVVGGASVLVFVVLGVSLLVFTKAATNQASFEAESGQESIALEQQVPGASGGKAVRFGAAGAVNGYQTNLAMIKSQTIRNKNHDNSAYKNTLQSQLPIGNDSPLLGPRSAYLNNPNGNPEQAFPIPEGGQNRTACEFSHFAYDDPLLYPGVPGKAHLHMFFGNTDVNAYSTYDTLKDSGSSTCNGQELNRSGYWAPAMIDGQGNARIPERVVVYYKGPNPVQDAQVYKPGMANISPMPTSVAEVPIQNGGGQGEANYKCSDNFSGPNTPKGVDEIPTCVGQSGSYPNVRTVLEMEIKFFYCWPKNNTNYGDYTQWRASGVNRGSWFFGNCDGRYGGNGPTGDNDLYPAISYFINYVVMPGEDTSSWYLSSDVDKTSVGTTPRLTGTRGSMHHADWWGGWQKDINKEWVDNCVNYKDPSGAAADCGFGYLSNGGPNNATPYPGRALKYRPQYDTQGNSANYKVSLNSLYSQLCIPLNPTHAYNQNAPMSGAYCKP